ncbi:hypothetical protein ZYGR_0E01010 [Zygosaccharomyces rouxii]|uniref:ZYRO0B02222p n=2 Tax=Zygosaccharomyces rouxii TaxID=4956 RepID=C5DQQ7_ZYGRC|nr:uncharacterized protein ZYRO0B02222g [Zygosaccharomyces rouxii]KAH9200332.1 hypothetical protein LQ764DRAFT_114664 [Zygosaccharomyces rouxii]GAV47086.1 hypothetical protein ZYGR_0E01010 [Zygosaccharomyces rouxii]CAR26118.1 ZYRO0B02222p [Zygosaccharomyces rouxii]
MASQSALFQELRPLCVDLSRQAFLPPNTFDPSSLTLLNALKRLESKLTFYHDESLSQKLAEYVFVPIVSLLKQSGLGDSQTEYVLRIITHLLRLSWRSKGTFAKELAEQLLPLVTFLISQDKENSKISEKPLEYKSAGCGVLLQFFTSLRDQSYKFQFFSSSKPKSLLSLGHCITILLGLLESTSQDPQTQIQALEALRILYQEIIGDGEIISFVLPGNVSSFVKVFLSPGVNVNYKVVVKTLQVLSIILRMVYDDFTLDAHRSRFTDVNELITFKEEHPDVDVNRRIEMHLESPSQHRSLSWLLGTSSQVKRALDSFIPKLLKRQNQEITDALTDFTSNLLKHSKNSLSNCQYSLVSTLVSLRRDPYSQLPEHLEYLQQLVEGKAGKLNNIIKLENEQELLSLSYALDILVQCDPTKDFSLLKDIGGNILEALESDITSTLSRRRNFKITEQSSNVILAGDLEAEIVHCQDSVAILPTMSKRLEDTIGKLLMSAGRMAGQESQLSLLIETTLSEQSCSNTIRKTLALWSSAWAIRGLYNGQQSNNEMNAFLDTGEDEEYTYEPCYAILDFCNGLAQELTVVQEGRSMSLQEETVLSVVLFTIESVCQVMHKDFEPELIEYLYTTVENLASPSPIVRHFAQSCSLTISQTLYNGSIQQMLLSNVDYLVDSISTRLNLGMTERVSAVFAVICKIAGYETIETFKDVIETIFKMLDYYHGYDELCIQFFQLFEVIILEMKKRFLQVDEQLTLGSDHLVTNAYSPWGMTNVKQLVSILGKPNPEDEPLVDEYTKEPSSFQEYFDSKIQEADSDDEDEEHAEEEGTEMEPLAPKEKWSSPIPLDSYRILLEVFHYGDRLLTHPSKPLRVQILQVMELIVPMLSTQYNSMLPQIANVWESVVQCTLSSDYTIVKPACLCLRKIIHYSGDFVAKRFFELWDRWCQGSSLLKEVRVARSGGSGKAEVGNSQMSTHRKFPPVTKDALVALAGLLLEGITVTELMLPDTTLTDMLYCCIQVIPADTVAETSLLLADVVWTLKDTN